MPTAAAALAVRFEAVVMAPEARLEAVFYARSAHHFLFICGTHQDTLHCMLVRLMVLNVKRSWGREVIVAENDHQGLMELAP